jgi:hypothetical protein
MANFTNTFLPPTLRLGNTADPILAVPRNTAGDVKHDAELTRPIIERALQSAAVIVEFKRVVVAPRRAKRLRPSVTKRSG